MWFQPSLDKHDLKNSLKYYFKEAHPKIFERRLQIETDRDTDRKTHTDTDPDADADTYTYTDTNPDTDADTDTETCTDADTDTDTDTDTKTECEDPASVCLSANDSTVDANVPCLTTRDVLKFK
ncbi:hypothetical protein HELRODRAFT_160365 [Helobdella robusta]|uniref:Uncharacterized protein n=1 Tax=Helobdella robusta TaxID=6412 RepID=T1EQ53_HELRO|nr:hypothetical protein HELRODRAFT_160365 [Helobdella robusta]ESO06207.1 hypothetical protein HELRODRAFT_160365 [Helobdella robusta]